MLIMSNMGDQVWLMTSRQTEPLLCEDSVLHPSPQGKGKGWRAVEGARQGNKRTAARAYSSSMLGWKMRFTKPMLGLL